MNRVRQPGLWAFAAVLGLGIFVPGPARSMEAAYVQDDDAGFCSRFNRCKKRTSRERELCDKCKRRKKYAGDYACSSCARKEGVCKICGRPRKGSRGLGRRQGRGAGNGGGTLEDAMRLIVADDMKKFLMVFASDEFEGRDNQSPGIQKAREFLIKHFKEVGAKPLNRGSYEIPFARGINLGVLFEGSDPKLKNEYIVIGSHYDHIGKSARVRGDNIYNGADDNGSGSTLNWAICRALYRSGIKTKRSIIQLWFSAEEDGLLGSRAYCARPVIPMSQTRAMLNCDMVGRNPDKPASLWGVGSSPQFSKAVDAALARVPDANISKIMGKGRYFDRSDQASFWRKGVPVMFLSTGIHGDYHKPGDHPEKIAYGRMAKLGRFVLCLAVYLADLEEPIIRNENYR